MFQVQGKGGGILTVYRPGYRVETVLSEVSGQGQD